MPNDTKHTTKSRITSFIFNRKFSKANSFTKPIQYKNMIYRLAINNLLSKSKLIIHQKTCTKNDPKSEDKKFENKFVPSYNF